MREPGFYCEGCGTKVDKWAIECPSCNRIFDSIKCPRCNFTGTARQFTNGCPVCGFQSQEQKDRIAQQAKLHAKHKSASHPISSKEKKENRVSAIFYKVSIALLIVIIIVLIGFIINQ